MTQAPDLQFPLLAWAFHSTSLIQRSQGSYGREFHQKPFFFFTINFAGSLLTSLPLYKCSNARFWGPFGSPWFSKIDIPLHLSTQVHWRFIWPCTYFYLCKMGVKYLVYGVVRNKWVFVSEVFRIMFGTYPWAVKYSF